MDFDTLWQDVSLSRIKLTFLQAKLSFCFFLYWRFVLCAYKCCVKIFIQ